MFIFDSNRFARERAGLPAEVEKAIKAAAAKSWSAGCGKSAAWRTRSPASEGHLLADLFPRPELASLAPLNRQWEIHDGILRHLVLKVHPHLVEAVLEHAKAGPDRRSRLRPRPVRFTRVETENRVAAPANSTRSPRLAVRPWASRWLDDDSGLHVQAAITP